MELPVIDEKPWYHEGLRFTCTQCGNCCSGPPGFVWISQDEIARLAEHLHLEPAEVMRKFCRKLGGRISLKEKLSPLGEHDCIFLQEQQMPDGSRRRGCSIYAVRPLQCRTWPFWHGLLRSREDWDRATRRCPGMNHGRHFTREQIEQIRDQRDW